MPTTKDIATPEKLKALFVAYKEEVDNNPIQVVEQIKQRVTIPKDFTGKLSDLIQTSLPIQRPLTMCGFENYVFDQGLCEWGLAHYFANTDDRYSEYITICSYIRRTIRNNQIEGGMAGIYNASITQRLNGLTEKTEVNVKAEQRMFGELKEQKQIEE